MYNYQGYGMRKKKSWPFLLVTFLIAAIGSYFVQTYLTVITGGEEVKRLSNEVQYSNFQVVEERKLTDVVEDVMQSVVGISMLKANEESIFDISLTEKWGLGTGVIVSEDGYILTNQHLARSANTRLIVNLENGETAQGKVIWCDENVDLAVVKIDKKNLVPAKIGNSDNLKIGEEVLAIGNPLGVEFQRTTTKGIVSGLNRTLQFEENGNTVLMEDLIQTDASINTGNSGGPLINLSGEVVGINTVKITSAEGMGFAVPIDIVLPILNKIENGKKIKEAKLGMFVYDKEIVKYMKSNKNIEKGLYVTDVSKLGAADKAGIRKGDVLISVDGVELDKVTDLRRYIYEKEVGDTVSFIINRNNRIESVNLPWMPFILFSN